MSAKNNAVKAPLYVTAKNSNSLLVFFKCAAGREWHIRYTKTSKGIEYPDEVNVLLKFPIALVIGKVLFAFFANKTAPAEVKLRFKKDLELLRAYAKSVYTSGFKAAKRDLS